MTFLLVACNDEISEHESMESAIYSATPHPSTDVASSTDISDVSEDDILSDISSDMPSKEPSSETSSGEDSDDSPPENESSQDEPSSNAPSHEESDEIPPQDNPDEEPSTEFTSISSINRNDAAINLARGKGYTSSIAPHEKYPDNGTLLTNGKLKNNFDPESWAGYYRPEALTIVLDLGKVEDFLADFCVSTLRLTDYGIGSPAHVLFEISEDGKTYQKIGKVYSPADVTPNLSLDYRINLMETVSARYVRLTFANVDGPWLFVGEITVIRYISTSHQDLYYGAHMPTTSVPAYWPKGEQNDQSINLLLYKKPYVISKEPISIDHSTEYYNSIVALPRLTDNRFGTKATYSDDALAHFTRATERSVYFDFGYLSAVTSLKYSFLNDNSSGVFAPGELFLYLSDDGAKWELVSMVKLAPSGSSVYCRGESKLKKTYIARYAKFVFEVSSHVFCDELQIYGTKAIPEGASNIVHTPEDGKEKELGYMTPDKFLGVNNVMLSYHCLPDGSIHSENGLITVEEYLPYVGYYDTDGKLIDTFFDAFLYLPYTKFNYDDISHTLDGWNFYLDDIYYPGRNMDALDQAVSQAKKKLSIPDYKCTVFTSILYTWTKMDDGTWNTFGDINGDGKPESFDALENRKKAIKWLIDQEYQRFLENNYSNLTFGGFYWFEEAVSVHNEDERALIRFASDYVHSLGLKLFWIPYYCASGYNQWAELGFDVACMQPNYMFGNSGNPDVLKLTADKTRMLGMCVEIEMNSVSNADEVRRYMQYLEAGAKYGYMHAVKMYYQGGVPGAFYHAYLSQDPNQRSVYDFTYLFAKEKFANTPPEHTVLDDTFITENGVTRGAKIFEAKGAYSICLAVSPQHGDLQMNLDSTFTYYADSQYTGEDRFAIYLDYGFSRTEEIVITIHVN